MPQESRKCMQSFSHLYSKEATCNEIRSYWGQKTFTTIPNGGQLYVRYKVDQGIKYGYSQCNCHLAMGLLIAIIPNQVIQHVSFYTSIFIYLSSLLNNCRISSKGLNCGVCWCSYMSLNPKPSSSQWHVPLKIK